MKMAINAVSAKTGGAVTYLKNVLRCLPSPESGHEFVVFLPPGCAVSRDELPDNIKLVPTDIGSAKFWKRFWWEQFTLLNILRELNTQALFSTANFGMFLCPVRQILLVRNSLYFSETYIDGFLPRHSLRFRLSFRLRYWLCYWSVHRADVVMTPTQAMLGDLRPLVRVDPRKALVNHYGVALPESLSEGPAKPSIMYDSNVIRLAYVSLYSEHKNLGTLLKAMPLLNRNARPRFVLTTTANPALGEAQWTVTHKQDLALARRPEITRCVTFVEPLNPQKTSELYQRSDIFVFPSLTESFGHPMAEAMAHGLPIVAADTPVNHEICGDAAVYFIPLDPDDLTQAIGRVVADDALRKRLILKGLRRVRERFRWDEHVWRILEVATSGQTQGLPAEQAQALSPPYS